mmetsp:Transcript_59610/g.140393  ORF Transcript_59610/g.140393 Transcript_59610/m.140393 type:complete len:316 (+) Transcript_59610:183-1130(+)
MARTRSMSALLGASGDTRDPLGGLARRERLQLARMASRLESGRSSPCTSFSQSNDGSKTLLLVLIGAAVVACVTVILLLPPISSVETKDSRFIWRPSTVDEFQQDKDLLERYRALHKWRLLVGMLVSYIILQGFCVPGSGTTLNVLAGCIFSDIVKGGEYWIAMPFAMVGATLGSTLCYLISYSTCTDFIQRRFPSQIEWLQKMILNQDSVFFCLLSLRLSPLVPGWFISIASPLTPVPLWQFSLATLVGVFPVSLVAVKTGATLSRLESGEESLMANGKHVGMLLILAAFAALPALYQRLKAKQDSPLSAKDFR